MVEAPLLRLNFFPVTCQNGSSLLRGRTRRALSAEEITKTCEVLLAVALRRRCRYWLVDGRVSPDSPPLALHEWLQEDYFPRVRAQLGKAPCIALVVAPTLWQGLEQPGCDSLPEWPMWGARVGWFKEEGAALAWLRQQEAFERENTRLCNWSADEQLDCRGKQLCFNF
jgi:hypothetical protein